MLLIKHLRKECKVLLKTTTELKSHFSNIEKDYNIGSLNSFIEDAENDLVIPEIGQAMYDAVKIAYEASIAVVPTAMDAKMQTLHRYIQKAITHFALYLSSDSGSFYISDSGYYVSISADRKPVSDKKMMLFRKGRAEAGYKALQLAIEYLETNIAELIFEPYATADQHLASRSYFINDAKTFTKYFRTIKGSPVTFRAMLDAQDESERRYLIKILGEDLFDSLKEKILDDDLTLIDKKLMPYIQRPLAYLTMAEAIPVLPIEFDGTNLFVNSLPAYGNSENVESKSAADQSRLSVLMNKCMMTGNENLKRLTDYLVKNAADFPLYVVADDYDENINNTERGLFFC